MNKRSLSSLSEVIGSVAEEHKETLIETAKEIKIDETAKVTKTSSISDSIGQPEVKVPESFKILPSLKTMVEEIVENSRKEGLRMTKGRIYNHLIAKGLADIKKD